MAYPFDTESEAKIWVPGRTVNPPRLNPIDINRVKVLPKPVVPIQVIQPVNPAGTGGIPQALTTMSAVESPTKVNNITYSLVSVSWQHNVSDKTYESVRIWFTGYKGQAGYTLMASGVTSPISFLVDTTKETVRCYVQPVGVSGASLPLSFCLNQALPLDGVQSPPPAPTISQATLATPTGLQFAFTQEGGLLADVVACYKLYKNTISSFPGVSGLFDTISQDPSNAGGTITKERTLANGTTEYYWVTAVNTSGLESTPASAGGAVSGSQLTGSGQLINADQIAADGISYIRTTNYPQGDVPVQNGGFQASTTLPVPGWIANVSSLSYETATQYPGKSQSLKVQAHVQFGGATSALKWSVVPGDQYVIYAAMKSDGTGTPCAAFIFVDKNGAQLSNLSAINGTSSSWTLQQATGIVPANAVYGYISLQNNTAAGAGVCWFDSITVARCKPLDLEVSDGNNYYRDPYITVPTVSNSLYNGDFTLFPTTQTVANGWNSVFERTGSGYTFSRSTTTSNAGITYSQAITNGSTGGTSIASRPFGVVGNMNYQFEFYVRSNHATPGTCYGRVLWYNSSASYARGAAASITDIVSPGVNDTMAANTWTSKSAVVQAPTGAKYAVVALYNWVGTANTMLFDQVAFCPSTIDPSTGIVLSKGGIPPSSSTAFTYSSTYNSVTWLWTSLTIYRSDGTTTVVPNGSLVTTGLTASSTTTTYYWFPFYDDIAKALKFVSTGGGSTLAAYTLIQSSNLTIVQTQNLQSHVPLANGPMTAVTPAHTTPPTSGGGAGGGCPCVDLWLDDTLMVGDARGGDPVLCLENDFMEGTFIHAEHDLTYTDIRQSECFEFETENGCIWRGSYDTPVPTQEAIADPEFYAILNGLLYPGLHVWTVVDGKYEWSKIIRHGRIGIRAVAHFSVGGRNFASGADKGKLVFTHNMRMVKF